MYTLDPFDLIGTVLDGRYRIEKVIGTGGFGVVYKGFHLHLEGPVAIKVLRVPSGLSEEERLSWLASFRNEGKLLFELSSVHPNIVHVKESGVMVLGGNLPIPYLVLEWLDGVPLDVEFERRRARDLAPRSMDEVFELLAPVAEALAITHERGIAHRDIKPGNIFLARAGEDLVPKLLDFGIAKVLDKAAGTTAMFAATREHVGTFTAMYGAPEQWLARIGATGPWTDVYAFALVMVEAIIGRAPLNGMDARQLMGATLDEKVRPTPGCRGVCLPEGVENTFRQALAVDPKARFRSMRAFWTQLAHELGRDSPFEIARQRFESSVAGSIQSACDNLSPPADDPSRNAGTSIPPDRGETDRETEESEVREPANTSEQFGTSVAPAFSDNGTGKARRLKVLGAVVCGLVLLAVGLSTAQRPVERMASARFSSSHGSNRALVATTAPPSDSAMHQAPVSVKVPRPVVRRERVSDIGPPSASVEVLAPPAEPGPELSVDELLRDRR